MKEKKEYHRSNLPHFQRSGQAYFITWHLKDAIPAKAFEFYNLQLEKLAGQINELTNMKAEESKIINLQQEYNLLNRKYIKAYNDQLDAECRPLVNLSKPANTAIILETLQFWEGKKLHNYAICIMCNHILWVFKLLKKDNEGQAVYLQDVLQSVKRYSSSKINKNEGRLGSLWQKESFDITIRNTHHLEIAINYTLNNPVKAGLTSNWKNWPGNYLQESNGSSDF